MSKKTIRERIKKEFDSEALKEICALDDFSGYADKFDLPKNKWSKDRFYWYKDNGSDILAIAHLDSVQDVRECQVVNTKAGPLVWSPVLDDRLGAYTILELLPRLGVECDWLLTTDEESCNSTAEAFLTDKKYQWMFSFDRAGKDVVMYDYETEEYAQLVEDSGAVVGQGSVSDISFLEHLGCAGFNWGVGYEDYHDMRSHAWLNDTFSMVGKFLKFYKANSNMILPHVWTPTVVSKFGSYYGQDDGWHWDEATGSWMSDEESSASWLDRLDDPDYQFRTDCPTCYLPLVDDGYCASCATDWREVDYQLAKDERAGTLDEASAEYLSAMDR